MKQKRRKRALDELLSQLDDREYDVREYALFQLALILERSNPRIDAAKIPDYHAENLTRDMLRLRLSPDEQTVVGARVAQLATGNRHHRSTVIWTLSKLSGEVGIPLLSGIVLSSGETFDDDSSMQVCEALLNWLAPSEATQDGRTDSEDSSTLLRVLRQWNRRGNDDLGRRSMQVICLLQQ